MGKPSPMTFAVMLPTSRYNRPARPWRPMMMTSASRILACSTMACSGTEDPTTTVSHSTPLSLAILRMSSRYGAISCCLRVTLALADLRDSTSILTTCRTIRRAAQAWLKKRASCSAPSLKMEPSVARSRVLASPRRLVEKRFMRAPRLWLKTLPLLSFSQFQYKHRAKIHQGTAPGFAPGKKRNAFESIRKHLMFDGQNDGQ